MTFQIDTTGEVPTTYNPVSRYRWSDLSPFTQGYIEALLRNAATFSEMTRHWGLRFSDLAPETLARIIADCEAFEPEPTVIVGEGYGRNFWRVRQRGDLSKFPPLTVQLGDDGKVRFA